MNPLKINSAAVIDIGTNSIKLIIGEWVDGTDHHYRIIESLKNLVPIGVSAFYSGQISFEVANVMIEILSKYKTTLQAYSPDKVLVIATTAMRESANQKLLLDAIERKTGFVVDVLNVGDIIYYIDTFLYHKLNKIYPIAEKNLIIAELGSGSLDISVMRKGAIITNMGLPLGTLRINQLFNNLDGSRQENIEAVSEYIEREIHQLFRSIAHVQIDDVIVIAENCGRQLCQWVSTQSAAQDLILIQRRDLDGLSKKISGKKKAFSAAPTRTDEAENSLPFVSVILSTFIRMIKSDHIYLLETSLAEAALFNALAVDETVQKYDKTKHLLSVVEFMCEKYEVDLGHARQVASLGTIIFSALSDYLGCLPSDSLYLSLAAYLHDIGGFFNNRGHHKHTEYIISNISLFRLTEEELKILACVARYHRKAYPTEYHVMFDSLLNASQLLVQKLSAILRIANALDISHRQKLSRLVVTQESENLIVFRARTYSNFMLEKNAFQENKEYLEEITGCSVSLVIEE